MKKVGFKAGDWVDKQLQLQYAKEEERLAFRDYWSHMHKFWGPKATLDGTMDAAYLDIEERVTAAMKRVDALEA